MSGHIDICANSRTITLHTGIQITNKIHFTSIKNLPKVQESLFVLCCFTVSELRMKRFHSKMDKKLSRLRMLHYMFGFSKVSVLGVWG